MANDAGEMPFLDHLEELRSRLLVSLVVVCVCVGIGIWAVLHLDLLVFLKQPIAEYLPGGKLTILGVTDQFMIVLKLGFVIGLVLASPVLMYEIWAFLSPALYERERKLMLPALVVGLGLFAFGVWAAWVYVLPFTLKVALTFQGDAFNPLITYEKYFGFVVQILLALGLMFELPLIMILLAMIGIMSARQYNSLRRYAMIVAFIAGALLSPGADVITMVLFTLPILLLYEVGVLGAVIVQRGKKRRAAQLAGIIALLFALHPSRAVAQDRPPSVLDRPNPADTGRRPTGQGVRQVDSATARRLGLPTAPKRVFPSPDSVMQRLLEASGFAVTRFMGDTATLFATDQRIILGGRAATVRDGATLEADQIVYDDGRCEMAARGTPQMFENNRILVGRTMRFDTCAERGVIGEALTTFNELGADWFVRGNLAVDSTGKRLYAASSEFTSCDLPIPHYYFRAGEVKWVSQSMLVARPAVLYVRDVPIVWLPFLFQDTKSGRRSGILIPQFGFNDIVRFDQGYNRQVTNIGYYWAPNDYLDLTAKFNWFSSRYIQYGADLQYNWINRFVQGGLGLNQTRESEGGTATQLVWRHNQKFNVTTSLTADLNYMSNTSVVQGNSVDPLLSTQEISSAAQFSKRLSWGTVTLGGNRRQSINDGSGSMLLPSLSIQPREVAIGEHITWSPAFSARNETQFKQRLPTLTTLDGGIRDTLSLTGSSRRTSIAFETPVRFGSFTWRNSVSVADQQVTGRQVVTVRVPDTSTADPSDSVTVSTVRGGGFESSLDWTTGINLPQLFSQTWKVTPTVGITNVTSGPFRLRNTATNGEWVQQGKRLQLGLTSAPTFFAFFNSGVGPIARIRHKLAPQFQFAWSPEATLSEEFAQALAGVGRPVASLDRPQAMTASVGLNQTIEAKLKPPPGDTTGNDQKWKRTLLSINTSAIQYDFEQAKEPGRTGWLTPSVTNSVNSDLIPGFQLSLTHDLWEGQVGTDTARFSPFLSAVQANFTLTGSTFRSIGSIFGLGKAPARARSDSGAPVIPTMLPSPNRFRPGAFGSSNAALSPGRQGFNASVNFSLSRSRPNGQVTSPLPTTSGGLGDPFGGQNDDPFGGLPLPFPVIPGTQSNLSLNTSFSPTQFWSVSWQTQYNLTDGRFESHQLQLQRDLHDWRAQINFVRSPNGNFSLFFSVYLMNLPDIKFDYNQTTLQP